MSGEKVYAVVGYGGMHEWWIESMHAKKLSAWREVFRLRWKEFTDAEDLARDIGKRDDIDGRWITDFYRENGNTFKVRAYDVRTDE